MDKAEQHELEQEELMLAEAFQQIVDAYTLHNPTGDFDLIKKAYLFAKDAHQGMRRKSGEPFITHPLAVALIAAKELELGATSVSAALLHDVVEDTDTTVADIEYHFGKRVALIVEGLTKLYGKDLTTDREYKQADNFRKLIITMCSDKRIAFIKLADRLHNMRTLNAMPPHKQYKIAGETQFVYAPIAKRLGFYPIKTELEDLSFKYKEPNTYDEIEALLKKATPSLDQLFKEFTAPIETLLTNQGYHFTIYKRIKTVFSIWKKMQKLQIPFEEVTDLMVPRIVFTADPTKGDEKAQCWAIYYAITSIYSPKDNEVQDWVDKPKTNQYEALHLTVMGTQGHFVEVQIRSDRMNEIAEKGVAAYWKLQTPDSKRIYFDDWIDTVIDQNEDPTKNPIEFVDNFLVDMCDSDFFVFTPKGEKKLLPKEATVLDFAFSIHTDLAYHCIGAKVNHKLVPASYVLNGGDQIEVITSAKQLPQIHWLNYVNTLKAKNKLRAYFEEKKSDDVKVGAKYIEELFHNLSISNTAELEENLVEHFNCTSIEDLYYKLGSDQIHLTSEELTQIRKQKTENKLIRFWRLNVSQRINLKKHATPHAKPGQYEVAKCCNPIPGDTVFGLVDSKTSSTTIHKQSCVNADRLQAEFGDQIVEVVWKSEAKMAFLATIRLQGVDRIGIVSEITKMVCENYEVSMKSVHFDSLDGIFEGNIELYVPNTKSIENLVKKIKMIDGLRIVNRIENVSYIINTK